MCFTVAQGKKLDEAGKALLQGSSFITKKQKESPNNMI